MKSNDFSPKVFDMKNENFSHENRPDIHEDFGLMNIFHENFLRCRPSKSPMNIRERYLVLCSSS